MGRKLTNSEVAERIKNINDNFELVGEYKGAGFRTPTLLRCKKHNLVFSQNMSSFFSGQNGCPFCKSEILSEKLKAPRKTRERISSHEEFINKVSTLENLEHYDFSKTKWINNDTKVVITCRKHGDFLITPKSFVRGSGCQTCAYEARIKASSDTFSDFLGKAKAKHHGVYDYSLAEGVYVDSKRKIPIICSKHGEFWQMPAKHLSGQGCPICRKSHGAEQILFFLRENGVKVIPEFVFEGCKDRQPLPFDFYLPEYNTCIEYQGRQHFEKVEAWESHGGLVYTQKHDLMKLNYCKKNGITLIIITYKDEEFIPQILEASLF